MKNKITGGGVGGTNNNSGLQQATATMILESIRTLNTKLLQPKTEHLIFPPNLFCRDLPYCCQTQHHVSIAQPKTLSSSLTSFCFVIACI